MERDILNTSKYFNAYSMIRSSDYLQKLVSGGLNPDNMEIQNPILRNLLSISCYRPSDFIIDKVMNHSWFTTYDLKDEIEVFANMMGYDNSNDMPKDILMDIQLFIIKSVQKYMKDTKKKDDFKITYHLAWRFVKRYSHEYDLNGIVNEVRIYEAKTIMMESLSEIVKNTMYSHFKNVIKKGRDPYKFYKISPEFYQYLNRIKYRYGQGTKVKVYSDSIWILKENQGKLVFITMYKVPYRFIKFIDETEFIDSFYNILKDKSLLNKPIPILSGKNSEDETCVLTIMFRRDEKIEKYKERH